MLARSFLIESSSKLLVTRTGIKARSSSILGLWFPWPIVASRSLPFELLVFSSHLLGTNPHLLGTNSFNPLSARVFSGKCQDASHVASCLLVLATSTFKFGFKLNNDVQNFRAVTLQMYRDSAEKDIRYKWENCLRFMRYEKKKEKNVKQEKMSQMCKTAAVINVKQVL